VTEEQKESKIIVIPWVGPHDPPTKCIDSWKDNHPEKNGWKFMVVTSEEGWENQAVIDALVDYGSKADVIRYEVLAALGVPGVCVDADVECTQALDATGPTGKPLTEFFAPEAFASYEGEVVVPGVVSTAIMGGRPGAAFWRKCVEEVGKLDLDEIKSRKRGAADLVGSGLLTRLAKDFTARDKFTIFSSKVVNPIHSSGVKTVARGPGYGMHYWGTAKTYNTIRPWQCQCAVCRTQLPSWRLPWM